MTRFPARPAVAVAAALVLLVPGLAGCSREADDWRGAQAADTSMSYQQFLHQYPKSAHVNEANTRLAQLAEDEAWQGATSVDTQMGYQQFLARYPDGKWAQEARVRIENFSLTPPSLPPPAAPPPESPKPVAPLKPEPEKPAEAPKPAPAPAASPKKKVAEPRHAVSGFGVQLGAFSSQAKADAAWARLEKQFHDELGSATHRVEPGRSGAAQVFRLRVPLPGEPVARKLCDRLKAHNEVCVVYRP